MTMSAERPTDFIVATNRDPFPIAGSEIISARTMRGLNFGSLRWSATKSNTITGGRPMRVSPSILVMRTTSSQRCVHPVPIMGGDDTNGSGQPCVAADPRWAPHTALGRSPNRFGRCWGVLSGGTPVRPAARNPALGLCSLVGAAEATVGIEPTHGGFADRSVPTSPRRHDAIEALGRDSMSYRSG